MLSNLGSHLNPSCLTVRTTFLKKNNLGRCVISQTEEAKISRMRKTSSEVVKRVAFGKLRAADNHTLNGNTSLPFPLVANLSRLSMTINNNNNNLYL